MSGSPGRVLITGATGGIGQAIARSFASSGASLVLSGRRTDVLEPLARELGARALSADLGDRVSLLGLVQQAGELDIVVANAALQAGGRLIDKSQAEIDNLLEVNLGSQIALARAVLPGMLARRRGHLVFISSLSGKVTSVESSMYNATKFGLRGFSLALREDLHGTGVSASVICPGFVSDAGMFHDAGVKLPPGVGTVTPEQVAGAVQKAVSRNRAEISVAPLGLRIGAGVGSVFPQLGAFVQRHSGGNAIAHGLAASQPNAIADGLAASQPTPPAPPRT
jgi:short-subunit dehydrogenase